MILPWLVSAFSLTTGQDTINGWRGGAGFSKLTVDFLPAFRTVSR